MANRILVVEDNPDNMKLVTWMLEDEGYHITPAGTGEEALTLANNEQFDVILMDISLPGMNGKEATRQLRQTEQYKDSPIFALTAHAIVSEERDILASGVSELITKPINEELLLEKLQSYLQA